MSSTESADYLAKAHRWMEGDKYGSISGANATQVTTLALMSIATDIRRLAEVLAPPMIHPSMMAVANQTAVKAPDDA